MLKFLKQYKFQFVLLNIFVIFPYCFGMVIYPIIREGSWVHLQSVWSHWQTFNVAMIAFIASIIALSISHVQNEKLRQRRFTSARAFLPQALSNLISYCKETYRFIDEAYQMIESNGINDVPNTLPTVPKIDENVFLTFEKCIEHADPNVGEKLCEILRDLQVHTARINTLGDDIKNPHLIVMPENVASQYFDAAKITAYANQLYDFARGKGEYSEKSLEKADYTTALLNLDWQSMDTRHIREYLDRKFSV